MAFENPTGIDLSRAVAGKKIFFFDFLCKNGGFFYFLIPKIRIWIVFSGKMSVFHVQIEVIVIANNRPCTIHPRLQRDFLVELEQFFAWLSAIEVDEIREHAQLIKQIGEHSHTLIQPITEGMVATNPSRDMPWSD